MKGRWPPEARCAWRPHDVARYEVTVSTLTLIVYWPSQTQDRRKARHILEATPRAVPPTRLWCTPCVRIQWVGNLSAPTCHGGPCTAHSAGQGENRVPFEFCVSGNWAGNSASWAAQSYRLHYRGGTLQGTTSMHNYMSRNFEWMCDKVGWDRAQRGQE